MNMFVDFYTADQIAVYCAILDMKCRLKLSQKNIVNEPSYVAILTSLIQDQFKKEGIKCRSQVLEKTDEQRFGTDGIIVFQANNKIKAGLFEAKRPKILESSSNWDSLIRKKGISHFSEQIERQRLWTGQLAIWEMFLNEAKPGTMHQPFDSFGSSCVWHENAHSFMHKEKLVFQAWSTDNLKELLALNGISFYSVIYDILSCRVGKVHDVDPNDQFCIVHNQVNNNMTMRIPLPTQSQDWEVEVRNFLVERQIGSYIHIDIPTNVDRSWEI